MTKIEKSQSEQANSYCTSCSGSDNGTVPSVVGWPQRWLWIRGHAAEALKTRVPISDSHVNSPKKIQCQEKQQSLLAASLCPGSLRNLDSREEKREKSRAPNVLWPDHAYKQRFAYTDTHTRGKQVVSANFCNIGYLR